MAIGHDALFPAEQSGANIVVEPAGTILSWDKDAERVFGYPEAESIGRSILDLLVEFGRDNGIAELLHDALVSDRGVFEGWLTGRGDVPIHVHMVSRPIRQPGRLDPTISLIARDTTDHRFQRDAVLANARFSDVLESIPDAIVVINPTGRIVFVNSQAEHLFAYESGELKDKFVDLLLPHRYREPHVGHREHYFAKPRKRGMGTTSELFGLRKDGIEFPVDISLSPLRLDESTLLVVSAIRDMTDRRQRETELANERSRADRANRAKSDFLAGMSHELRTPLNAIIGFAEFIHDQAGDLTARKIVEYVDDIHRAGEHMLGLINNLLDLSKAEAGKMELELSAISLPDLMARAFGMIEGSAREKNLELVKRLPMSLPPIEADERKLLQIMLNLLSNAIKFTRPGGTVTLSMEIRPDDVIEIEISDTGIGIAPNDIKKVLIPFNQIRNPLSREETSTGLGLPLTKHLVELHGGTLDIQSAPGVGTTVILRIPAEARPRRKEA